MTIEKKEFITIRIVLPIEPESNKTEVESSVKIELYFSKLQ